MKRRMGEIAGFRPYRKRMCMYMTAAAVLVIVALLLAVHIHSYAWYSDDENIFIYEYADGVGTVISNHDSNIYQMISYDDNYVYVDREAFGVFCANNNVAGDVYIVFGGFNKLPGFSSGGESCLYEADLGTGVVRIPYKRHCCSAASNPLLYKNFKLCLDFCAAKLPSLHICRRSKTLVCVSVPSFS